MEATKLCPAPNLEAADFDKDAIVTIVNVGFKEVGEERKNKGFVAFAEFDRPMVLNRTNLKRIIAIYGKDTDAWKGKKITIYPSETDMAGKTVACLRVRERAPETK